MVQLSGSKLWTRFSLPVAIVLTCFLSAPHAINPGCKCIRFTNTFGKEWGVFSSPDFPNNYPPGVRCLLYSFQAPKDYIVQIVLDQFHLPPPVSPHGCGNGDFLKFFLHLEGDGGVNQNTPWNSVLCGRTSNQSFYSSSRHLIIQFHSTNSNRPYVSSVGSNVPPLSFIGHFRFLNSSQFESNGRLVPGSKCDYQFLSANYTAAEGRFFSPNYPSSYPHNIKCSYHFHASCLNKTDVIRILDGSSPKSPVISLICNAVKEFEILSSGPDLLVDFISNSDEPSTGFVAKFMFAKVQLDHPFDGLRIGKNQQSYDLNNYGLEGLTQASTLVPQCNQIITSDSGRNGSFASQNYPHPYPAKNCRYDFIGHGKQRIQIVFTDFSLYHPEIEPKSCAGEDSVTPFVHSDGNLAKLADFCGSNTPLAIMSNGHRLTLDLIAAKSSRNSRGFSALYYFVEDFGITGTGQQLSDFPCAFVYNSTVQKNGSLGSPNSGAFYPRNTECHYFFHGNDNEHVELHFTEFNLQGAPPCDETTNSDYVEFSNFMPVDSKFKRHCGTHKDLRVESDRKFFRVTFRSNSKGDGTGFLANFHFSDKPHKRQTLSSNSDSIVTFYFRWLILTIVPTIFQR